MKLMCIVPSTFVDSSLALVVLFRKRLKSVAGVLQGFRSKVFQSVNVGCSSKLLGICHVVMVRVVTISISFVPGIRRIPSGFTWFSKEGF